MLVIAPEGREAVYLLKDGVFVVGRNPAADLYLSDATVSWRHASFTRRGADEARLTSVAVEDHGSTNGTWINGIRLRGRAMLNDRDVVRVGTFSFAFAVLDELQLGATARLLQRASTDALTGLLNRGAFERDLRVHIAEAACCGWTLSLLVLDVDHFKGFNDQFGHGFGDLVLQRLAAKIQACARTHDQVGRVGGEEFAAILPGASLQRALGVAERVRNGIALDPGIAPGHRVTVSVGVACLPAGSTCSGEEALAMADTHMYRAKAEGRNCVRGGEFTLPKGPA